MAKIYGLGGDMVGKMANQVFAVVHGVNIVRKYNPNVTNPNTDAQIMSRAKLKLISQLSASLQSIIAISRDGSKSPRNIFTQKNYKFAGFTDEQATFAMANVQLTNGSRALTGFSVTRGAENITAELSEDMSSLYSKVVYVIIKRLSSGTVAPVLSRVQSAAGANGTFPITLPQVDGDITVCAYGISFASAESMEKFNSYNVESGSDVAKLLATKKVDPSTLIFSETRGLSLLASGDSGSTTGRHAITLSTVTGSTTGTYQGAGSYAPGETVTIVASAQDSANLHSFEGWYSDQAGTTLLSANRSYTFTMGSAQQTIYAKYYSGNEGGSGDES